MAHLLADDAGLQVADGLVLLQCPRCCTAYREKYLDNTEGRIFYSCKRCDFQMSSEDGIWQGIPEERLARYAGFLEDYQRIRALEGRGSQQAAYYLGLPFQDSSGLLVEQWKIRACTYSYLSEGLLQRLLAKHDSSPAILDIGAGNGWMSYRLAQQGYRPVAVDLLVNHRDGLGAADHYREALPQLFPRFRAESEHLPFADNQFDAVIFNASFHYATSYQNTLREALRCLRPGGCVIIADSPWYAHEESGQAMVAERRALYLKRYGTSSASLPSLEFLTDQRLEELERTFHLRWTKHTPEYGLSWRLRPLLAKVRGRRTPSRFHIFCARKAA